MRPTASATRAGSGSDASQNGAAASGLLAAPPRHGLTILGSSAGGGTGAPLQLTPKTPWRQSPPHISVREPVQTMLHSASGRTSAPAVMASPQ